MDTTFEPASEIINVWHVKAAGPKGGRPIERPLAVDANGLRILLDTLPPVDRVRLPNGEEVAGRCDRSPADITALVPTMTTDQQHVEFTRRENLAMISDMAAMRREFMAGTMETMKVMRAHIDSMQATAEKFADLADRSAEKSQSDLTDKVLEAVLGRLMGSGSPLGALMKSGG